MKRCLSLLEVVIALGLTAILLTSLFSCYRHLVLSKLQIEKTRDFLYPKLFTHARLIQVFDSLQEKQTFHTKKEALLFTVDNGLDRDPAFCGTLTGKLSLKKQHLTLKLSNIEGKSRSEVLQTEIQELSFSFFDLEKKAWQAKWKGGKFPAQVRILLDGDPITFSIPSTDHMVHYE